MASAEQVESTGYEVLDGLWQFDLKFYCDIGLDLDPLEDPADNAAVPRLRRTAETFVLATESERADQDQLQRAQIHLIRAHNTVKELMAQALAGINYEGVDQNHPAVTAWQERKDYEADDIRFDRLNWIGLTLVRDYMPAIDPYSATPKYYRVSVPFAGPYLSPITVADQLTTARVAALWDI